MKNQAVRKSGFQLHGELLVYLLLQIWTTAEKPHESATETHTQWCEWKKSVLPLLISFFALTPY